MKRLIFIIILLLCGYANAQPLPPSRAKQIKTNTANFSGNLSAADTDVQKALETIDGMAGGGGTIDDDVQVNGSAVDTTANFTDNIYVDFTITDGGSGGPDAVNAKFNYAETLAGNPALLVDECVLMKDASGGGFICEGSTADTNEQIYRFPDVNGADTDQEIVLDDSTQTLTNKTLAAANNVIDADTAVSLAANGSNCSAGNYPLGVDASGATESCTADDDTPESGDFGNLTGGAGVTNTAGTLATASDEADFVKSGELTCGASTQGKMQVHTTPLQYCDNAATPAIQYAAYGNSSGESTAAANDSVALTTDTTGNYAAGDAEAGNATGVACTDCVALGTETSGNYAGSSSEGGAATTAAALSANPSDCATATHFAVGVTADGTATCEAISDDDVPDTITASSYLPLAGGTLTGQLTTDNLGIEFEDSDTNPTCAAGNYAIYADLSEGKLKKCTNGSATDLDTGGSETNTLTTITTGIADDQLPVGTASDTVAYKTLPDCDDSGGNHLNYDTTTNAFSCGTAASGAGGWTDGGTNVYVTTTTDDVAIGATSPGSAKLLVKGDGTGTAINTQWQDSSGTPRMTILDNGNIGIGTTAPKNRLQIDSRSVFIEESGDLWITNNAYWDGTHWQRINTNRRSFALEMMGGGNGFPGEPASSDGVAIWKAECDGYDGSNYTSCLGTTQINDAFGTSGGWEILGSWLYGNYVMGGQGVELDGNGVVPYGRVIHNNQLSTEQTALVRNVFADFSGVDDEAEPSLFAGFSDPSGADNDFYRIMRADEAITGSGQNTYSNWTHFLDIDSNGNTGVGNSAPTAKLQVNGKIVSDGSLDVKNGATSSGVLAIYEDSDDGTNFASFQVPALAANTVYTLPADDGGAGQYLKSDGSGTLSWDSPSGSGDITDVFSCASGDCSSITMAATDFLDMSGTDASTTTEGLKLPQHATACAGGTAEGQVCWEADADKLWIGNGSTLTEIGAGGSGDITDVFSCASGDCASITMAATDLLDMSGTDASTATEGLILPQHATACAGGTAEGQVCWEADANILHIGDSAALKDFIPTSAFSGDATVSTTGTVAIQADSVALTTDTTGNYAAGDAEAGNALTGDSATAFFSAGTIEAARLPDADDDASTKGIATWADADVDCTTGSCSIASALTRDTEWDTEGEVQTAWGSVNILLETEIDASSELAALMDDETGSGALVFGTSPTFTTSIAIPNGTAPTVDAAGEIAVDTTSDQLVYYGGAKRVISKFHEKCVTLENPVAADDNVPFYHPREAITVTDVTCEVDGGTSIELIISDGTNALETITCDGDGAQDDGSIANGTFTADERMEFDLGTVSGTNTWLNFCVTYTIDSD